ncbi:zinc finger BED domain-containing protein RICESLEEPER 2-like [Asparagus officinalis]|uniref:zinc finger BED domain-containing protein RICESLEEPER 2-like n=1 Tax=Asparagus officinalis TaxID=4686 RepID=UPI00098E0EAA|nr:zinc finger BED domain-containing protein RICESLEEPER 2-like [Asparagus officinalis]
MSSPNMNPASDSHAPSLSSSAPANTSSPSLSSSAPANASSPSPATPSSDNTDNASRENVETTNPIQEKRRRKKTSKVWDNFVEVTRANNVKRWRCNHCKHDFAQNSTGTTSHLKTHLNNCITKKLHDQRQQTLNFQRDGSTIERPIMLPPGGKYNHLKVREALAHWVMMHEHPFTVAEEEGFLFLMKTVNLEFIKIGRKTLKEDCMTIFESEKNKMKGLLKNMDRVSLTTDLWKSENQKIEYMVITGHFVDKDWNLQKSVLSFVHVPPPRRGIDIADAMHKCFKDWGIENKVFTISVDNASYNDVCLRTLKTSLSRHKKLVCDGKLFQVRCCAHILNLLVQDGISVIALTIENVRESIKFINHSEARLRTFSAIVQQLREKKLILDVPTRWNSTYLMLITALKFKDAFPMYKERESNYDCMPEPEEWDKVEKICKLLAVFHAVTNLISGSDYPTSNLYLIEVYRIKEVIDKSLLDNDFSIRQMAKKMQDKFEKYWGECNLLMAIASVMDPRLKIGAVEICYPQIYSEVEAMINIQKVRDALQELFDEYVALHDSNNEENSSLEGSMGASSDTSSSLSSLSSNWSDILKKVRTKDSMPASKSELETYLDEHVYICGEAENYHFSALNWWKTNQLKYRVLSRMAADILAVPISTVASESTFSAGGRVIDTYRASLDPKTVEALICGGDWMRKVHGIKKKKVEDEV